MIPTTMLGRVFACIKALTHFIFNTFTIKLNRVHQICNYSRFDFIVKVPRNGCVRVLIQLYYLAYIVEGTIYNHSGYRK